MALRDRRLRDEAAVEVLDRIRRDGERAPEKLRSAFEHVGRRLFDPELTGVELARLCPLAESRFQELFRRTVRKTPKDYVRSCRIHVATVLGRGTGLPAARIGRIVGYLTSSGFRRGFQALLGATFSRWRASLAPPPPELPQPRPFEKVDTWRRSLFDAAPTADLEELLDGMAELYPFLGSRRERPDLTRRSPAAGNDPGEAGRGEAEVDAAVLVFERFKAERVWALVRGLPRGQQEALLRHPVSFRTTALCDLLLAESRKVCEEASSPADLGIRRAIELNRLAMASLDACAAGLEDGLARRRALAQARTARLWYVLGELPEARRALSFAEVEWALPRPLNDRAVEAELVESQALLKGHDRQDLAEHAARLYRASGDEEAAERCRQMGDRTTRA